jgi:hypothetical protein
LYNITEKQKSKRLISKGRVFKPKDIKRIAKEEKEKAAFKRLKNSKRD